MPSTDLIVAINQTFNHWLAEAQTGRMRWYIASMVFGLCSADAGSDLAGVL